MRRCLILTLGLFLLPFLFQNDRAHAQTALVDPNVAFFVDSAQFQGEIFESEASACEAFDEESRPETTGFFETYQCGWCAADQCRGVCINQIDAPYTIDFEIRYEPTGPNAEISGRCGYDVFRKHIISGPPQCEVSADLSRVDQETLVGFKPLLVCPDNTYSFRTVNGTKLCEKQEEKVRECLQYGNPVDGLSGCKRESVALYQLRDNSTGYPVVARYSNRTDVPALGSLGLSSWRLDPVDRRLNVYGIFSSVSRVYATRPGGITEYFDRVAPQTYTSTIPRSNSYRRPMEPLRGSITRRARLKPIQKPDSSFESVVSMVAACRSNTTATDLVLSLATRANVLNLRLTRYRCSLKMRLKRQGTLVNMTFEDGAQIKFGYLPFEVGPVNIPIRRGFLANIEFEDSSNYAL